MRLEANSVNGQAGFLENLADDGCGRGLPCLDETGDGRVLSGGPSSIARQQGASAAVEYQGEDRRIGTGKMVRLARRTAARMAGHADHRHTATDTDTAEAAPSMPCSQGGSMREQAAVLGVEHGTHRAKGNRRLVHSCEPRAVDGESSLPFQGQPEEVTAFFPRAGMLR